MKVEKYRMKLKPRIFSYTDFIDAFNKVNYLNFTDYGRITFYGAGSLSK